MRVSVKVVIPALFSLGMAQVQAAEQHVQDAIVRSGEHPHQQTTTQTNQHHQQKDPAQINQLPKIAVPQGVSQPQIISASGVVKAIDAANRKITIAHQAIPAIGWPAMDMRFTYRTDDDTIRSINLGDQVTFSFIQQGNISLLQTINVS